MSRGRWIMRTIGGTWRSISSPASSIWTASRRSSMSVAAAALAKPDILDRLLAVQMLEAGLEMDRQVPPMVLIIHRPLDIQIDPAHQVNQPAKAPEVRA